MKQQRRIQRREARYTQPTLIRLTPEQHSRWSQHAAEYGCSLAEWIRSGVELMEDGQDAPHQTALECLRRLVSSSRGRRRQAWQRAEKALREAVEDVD